MIMNRNLYFSIVDTNKSTVDLSLLPSQGDIKLATINADYVKFIFVSDLVGLSS